MVQTLEATQMRLVGQFEVFSLTMRLPYILHGTVMPSVRCC